MRTGIALISYEYPPETPVGGIGTYMLQTGKLLADNDFDVHVFCGSTVGTKTSIEDGVTVHRIFCTDHTDFKNAVVPFFEKEHRSLAFSLIESAEINRDAAEIKKKYPALPLLVRLHAPNFLVEKLKKTYIPFGNKLRYFFGALRRGRWDLGYWRRYNHKKDPEYIFFRSADHVSAPGKEMKTRIINDWKADPERITIIENPFSEKKEFLAAQTGNNEHAVLFYGRLNVLKGLVTATQAMKTFLQKNPDWKWIIIGDDGPDAKGTGSMRSWMKTVLKDAENRVEFYDSMPKEKIAEHLRNASVVIIPSLFESYSYVTVESMAAGKAIIGSSGTGIASLITDGVNGRLADPYNANEWLESLQQLADDAEQRKKLGDAARHYADRKISVNKTIVEYYRSLTKPA